MKRVVTGLLMTMVAGGAVWAQGQAPASRPVVLQRVLVKVNGAVFTKTELEESQIEALSDSNQRQLSQLDLQSDAKLREMLIEITPRILNAAIDERIILQRARELGYKMSDEAFKSMVDSIKQENQLDEASFQAALKAQGMTMETLRPQLEKTYLMQAISRNEVMKNMTLTEEEARQYYRAHPDEFMTPTMMTLREIFIAVSSEADDAAALAKITQARERAVKGEDFAALVNEFSEAGSKANGGLIGPINLNELAESLKQRLTPLKTGDIDQPIRTPKGYQLLKVDSKSESTVRPFEEVRTEIGNRVYQERAQVMMDAYLDGMRDQAIIEWKDDELKKMYEQYRASLKKTQ